MSAWARRFWRWLHPIIHEGEVVSWTDPEGFVWTGYECFVCHQIHDMHRVPGRHGASKAIAGLAASPDSNGDRGTEKG